jgi:hypothetical protein
MTELTALWLPIVLSAIAVFVASSILHMVLPWHRDDYKSVPNEAGVRDAIRPFAIPPGDYMVPRPANPEEMKSATFKEGWRQGPNFMMTMLPSGDWSMGTNLVRWFIYCLVVSVFAAYVAGRAVPPGGEYLGVFRFAGVTAFVAYSAALWQAWIWYNRSLTSVLKSTIDGLIYGLLTAGFFGWLWP